MKSELEASFQDAANAGRPLLLEGGLDWKPLSLTPKDMDFIEAPSRRRQPRDVAQATTMRRRANESRFTPR